jgi:oligopeptide/dipeptide ABC transporter ATP-binding protein
MGDRNATQQPAATESAPDVPLLEVSGLQIALRRRNDEVLVVDTASFSVHRDGSLGVVGESGSGKSMLCRGLIGTLPRYGGRIAGGSIKWKGTELVGISERKWRSIRGRQIGYVPQSSMAGLNPILPIGKQLVEAIRSSSKDEYDYGKEARRLLDLVQIPRAEQVLKERSHQLSGGMRQRVIIAAALALNPDLLILDEPTTALDATVQADILRLISDIRHELGMAIIFVSHDLGVIESVCEQVMTMYAGAVVEIGQVASVRHQPLHPYTVALMSSRVDTARAGEDLMTIPGEPPTVGSWPDGCRFSPRCEVAIDDCRAGPQPTLASFGSGQSACLLTEEST